jgi:UDP-N-acetylmuramyl pentapeptide phosphotransferase/UDP-N-acetylglucosamine-1-phosphate transferase
VTDVWISVVAVVLGGATVAGGLALLPGTFRRPPHLRMNFRGRPVLGTAGVVLVVPLLLGAVLALMSQSGGEAGATAMLASGVVVGVLGYVDDVYGTRHARGFGGHVGELLHGRITTGLVKAVGGGVVGLGVAAALGLDGIHIAVGGAIVALSANIANLLDVRPGRAVKLWLPAAAGLVVIGLPGHSERLVLALVGGVVAFAVYELREQVMLGDTGAGLLGVVAGVAAIATLGWVASVVVLCALVALTAASEVVSFSRVIEAFAPLRWVDELGRRDDAA